MLPRSQNPDDDGPLFSLVLYPSVRGVELAPSQAGALHARDSLVVPDAWDGQFTALCDVGLPLL
jgi:hypothetical protein